MSPVIGGILYEKTGYTGVFCLGAGMLALDFIMRLLIIEKKKAVKYSQPSQDEQASAQDPESAGDEGAERANAEPSEEDPLLSGKKNDDDEAYKIHGEPNVLVRNFPILICFKNPRLVMSLALAFVQAALLAVYDATIPTEAQSLFQFTSLKAGLLFIPLDVPYLLLGPVAGWAVDRYGTKPAAVIGFGWMVPSLVLLRLPPEQFLPRSQNIVLYSALLALNGVGLAIIGAPSVVESSGVVERYDRANPGFFGRNGPYAQLYGFNSLFFCGGLTFGPVLAGALKDSVGYGDMNLVFAVLSGITALLSFFIIGGRPAILASRPR
jgi:Na+/melibiose symporter-like transporter